MGGRECGPARYSGRRALSVFFGICVAVAGCKRDAPVTADTKEQHERDLAALPQAASVEGPLAAESSARLKDSETVTLEALTAALTAQGLSFGEARQLMARPQLALYCARADSTSGLDVTVCEYPSAGQAERGEKEGNAVLDKVAGHSSHRQKKSVLHLVTRSDAPATEWQKVVAAFEALAASDVGR
jgi:hypothetical protein